MPLVLVLLSSGGCVMFDTSPARARLAELTDEDRDGVALVEDCNDADPLVYPGAEERCDHLDNDCDGEVDEDPPTEPFCTDGDGDGRGAVGSETLSCELPLNAVGSCDDCDDGDPEVFPGATERCNEHDDNCDGVVDELGSSDAPTWYRDGDGDGYGDPAVTDERCSALPGYVANADDCDDLRGEVHPDQEEVCNDGLDGNCDGSSDPCEWSGERKVDPGSWPVGEGGAVLGTYDYQVVGSRLQSVDWVEGLPPALTVTAFGEDEESGADDPGVVSIWLSPPYGESGLESASFTIHGVPGLNLGWGGSSYPVVDLDSDGSAELLLPAAYPVEGFHGGGQIVGVPVGLTGEYTVSPADVRIYSDIHDDGFGFAFAPTASMSETGPALVVGSPGDDTVGTNAGVVYLIGQGGSGPPDATARVFGGVRNDSVGMRLPVPRDLDQDGVDDLFVGADETEGSSWSFFPGPLTGDISLTDATTVFRVSGRNLVFQEVIEFAPWTDDGVEDVIFGPWGSNRAALMVVTEYPPGVHDLNDVAVVTLVSDEGLEDWHSAVTTGDFNGDGELDLAYSAYDMWLDEETRDVGTVYVRYGPLASIGSGGFRDTSDARFYGAAAEMEVGHGLHAADLTGDGHDDLLMFGSNPVLPASYEGGVFWLRGEGL